MSGLQVFDNDDIPPDAEFGCFQAINGPPESDFSNEVLVRLDVGKLASCIFLESSRCLANSCCLNAQACYYSGAACLTCCYLSRSLP